MILGVGITFKWDEFRPGFAINKPLDAYNCGEKVVFFYIWCFKVLVGLYPSPLANAITTSDKRNNGTGKKKWFGAIIM